MSGLPKPLRTAALFTGHIVLAVLGTVIAQSSIPRIRPKTLEGILLKEYGLSAMIAFALGYLVYHKWRQSEAMWIWVLGVLWFAQQAIHTWRIQGLFGTLHDVYLKMSGLNSPWEPSSLVDFTAYTIPLVRTVFYSAGAFSSWWFIPKLSRGIVPDGDGPTIGDSTDDRPEQH